MATIKVHRHAVNRFMERSGCTDFQEAFERVVEMFTKATPIEPRSRVIKLLNNNCKPADYFCFAQWIFVVVDGVVKTCYERRKGRWKFPK